MDDSPVQAADFSDAALILIGHGSTLNAASARPVHQHAGELRRRNVFRQVLEGFWKQEPFLTKIVRDVSSPRVFIVPLFISEGYFTEEVIPRELGFRPPGQTSFSRLQRRGGQTLFYCEPVGTHPSMTGVILARARGIVEEFPLPGASDPKDFTLFIAGHGTEKNENSRQAIERQVELLRSPRIYADVQAVFMEEEPRIGACYELARTRNIVMVPFFVSDGLHSREDIPVLLGESEAIVRERMKAGQPTWRNPTERKGKRLWYTSSIGSEPGLADVILERVRQAASGAGPGA